MPTHNICLCVANILLQTKVHTLNLTSVVLECKCNENNVGCCCATGQDAVCVCAILCMLGMMIKRRRRATITVLSGLNQMCNELGWELVGKSCRH